LLPLTRAYLTAPDPTLLLRDRHGRFLAELGNRGSDEVGYWRPDRLPERVVAATLAVEDRHFWRHPGVDPLAVVRALWGNLHGGRSVAGASTIAMQVARMQHPGRRTYLRKSAEATTALLLTARYGREGVLAHYLRIVPYGNRIHGIAYAARRYLDKPVEDLSWAEIAFLSAIPQAPAYMNPFVPKGRARAVQRGKRILHMLLQQGVLSPPEHELAVRQIDHLRVPALEARPSVAMHALLRLQERLQDPSVRRAFASRPIVTTTLDLDLQREVADIARRAIESWEPLGAGNAAVIVLDRRSGEVLAWLGSVDYFDATRAGAIDYTGVPRSPGSTLKPFLYALALERGVVRPGTVLADVRPAAGEILDADRAFLGPMLPRVALANSRNVPAAELVERLGIDEAYAFLREAGLHDGLWPAERYGLGLSVGALPVTLERLVRAYTVLAGDGRLGDLRWYEGQPRSEPRRILSEDTARQITLFLSDPMARLPSFKRMGASEYRFPAAIKTGTSSAYRDAWAVAYSTRYLVGAWVGRADGRSMMRLNAASSAAALVQEILTALHPEERTGLKDLSFPAPDGFRPVRVCALSGKIATPACDRVFVEWFRPGEEPVDSCDAHVRIAVDARDGRPATPATPAEFVHAQTFTVLDAEYATWAAGARLPLLPAGARAMNGPVETVGGPHVRILAPRQGLRVLRDPESTPSGNTLVLEAAVDPQVEQVVWYVDGAPFAVADYPYTTRWPLSAGEHVFQARIPYSTAASLTVRVHVLPDSASVHALGD
jgi:penicillin-binding protein 1C